MHENTPQRDILGPGWVKRISQVELAVLFAFKPYMKPLVYHGHFPIL